MLPIVKIPQVIEHFAPYFQDLFSASEYEGFKRYISGLIVSENKTVEGINRHFVIDVKDQSTLNRFLTDSSYQSEALNQRRLDYLQMNASTKFKFKGSIKGVLSIDDTLLCHYGSCFDNITQLRDPHTGLLSWSHCLVNLHYSDDKLDYPVYQQLWQPPDLEELEAKMEELSIFLNEEKRQAKKSKPKAWRTYLLHSRYKNKQYNYPELVLIYRTKLWIAIDLVNDFILNYPACDLPFCFDKWYTKPLLCNYITAQNRTYVGLLDTRVLVQINGKERISVLELADQLKKEQLQNSKQAHFHKVGVNWRGQTTHYYAYCKTHKLPAFGKVRLVISYKKEDLSDKTPYIIICNQHTWRTAGILNVYRRRWPVETFHEEGKAEGLNKYQIRQDKAIEKHIALISVVYSLLQAARYDDDLLSKIQQQLDQPLNTLVDGSVAHWRRVIQAQTLFNFVEWLKNTEHDSKDWKLLILPIIQIMTY